MASFERDTQVAADSLNISEKKETSVSVQPVPSPVTSESPTEQAVPHEWSNEPEQLTVPWIYEFAMFMYDLFLCVLTLALVAKTTLCIVSFKINCRRWEKSIGSVDTGSPLTTALQYLNAQIVTAFTIVFVTVMTTVTRRYALWKAQRGAYVSDLEQMCGSVSLPSTIKMVFVLRKFTLSSLALVSLWSFYYIGSQSSAREYVHVLSGPRHFVQAAVAGDDVVFDFTLPSNASISSDTISFINDEFKVNGWLNLATGVDLNGFLLVPDMRRKGYAEDGITLERRSEEELQQWMNVELGVLSGISWSGYAGREVQINMDDILGQKSNFSNWGYIGTADGSEGYSVVGTYLFTSSFITVDCDSVQVLGPNDMPLGTAETTKTSFNLSDSVNESTSNVAHSESFSIWHRWDQSELCNPFYDDCEEQRLIDGMNEGVLKIDCAIMRPNVEILATCPAGSCLTQMIRHLPTFASNPFANTSWAMAFFDHILRSTGPAYLDSGPQGDTNYQNHLRTNAFAEKLHANTSTADLLVDYGYAITQSFNTYLNIADRQISSGVSTPDDDPTSYQRFTMYGAMYFPQYRLIWHWIALDYVSTGILFIASIVSIWLRKHTLAPDIFGYVSSLTRDNPNVPVMEGGSSLSGIDRAKAMRKVKIKIADVGEEGEVGKVGVVYVHDSVNAQSLSKHRKYA